MEVEVEVVVKKRERRWKSGNILRERERGGEVKKWEYWDGGNIEMDVSIFPLFFRERERGRRRWKSERGCEKVGIFWEREREQTISVYLLSVAMMPTWLLWCLPDVLFFTPLSPQVTHTQEIFLQNGPPNPSSKSVDLWLRPRRTQLWAIQWASLDACWAREPGTVRGNCNRMRVDYRDARSMYTFKDTLPRLGNPRLEDRLGMGETLYFLAASLRTTYLRNVVL